MNAPLTYTQQQVLEFIRDFSAEKGYPPTRAEISHAFGWESAKAAQDHILELKRKGRLLVTTGIARGLRVA